MKSGVVKTAIKVPIIRFSVGSQLRFSISARAESRLQVGHGAETYNVRFNDGICELSRRRRIKVDQIVAITSREKHLNLNSRYTHLRAHTTSFQYALAMRAATCQGEPGRIIYRAVATRDMGPFSIRRFGAYVMRRLRDPRAFVDSSRRYRDKLV